MKWTVAIGCILALTSPIITHSNEIQQQAGVPELSFDDLRYRLGYDVYLANKNLAAAWQVANKALSADANNLFWLQRFAQVSEWIGKPVEALAAWRTYAQASNQQAAWDNVGRLAEALYDDETLLLYQKRVVGLNHNNEAAIIKLVATYERLGQPLEGLAFLQQLGKKSQAKRTLLTAEANLAERAGQDQHAITVLSQLIQHFKPIDNHWLLRRAALWFQRGKILEAWQSLAEIEAQMPARAPEYWHTYAELSRLLNKKEVAERAYQHLTDEFVFDEGDLINYAALQNENEPLNAAFLSELSYRLYKRDNAVINLLYLYQKANYPQGVHRFLALLSAEELARFEQNPLFLEQRGQFYWQQKQLAAAQSDYERALSLDPKRSTALQGLVGVLTEQGNRQFLQAVLLAANSTAQRSPALWQSWALAWLYLQQPSRALPFQHAYYRDHPQDALAALTLAELMANVGQNDEAYALRQHIFNQRLLFEQQATGERLTQLQNSLFALSLPQQAPEQSQYQLQQRLKNTQDISAFEQEVSLSWLLNHEQFDQARHWLAQRPSSAPIPAWASLNLALQNQDNDTINHLLNQQLEQLPIYDRIEAARRVNRDDLAEDLAFNTQDAYANDDELHRRYSDLLSVRGHQLQLETAQIELGALEQQQQLLLWATPLNRLWRMSAQIKQQQNSSSNHTLLNPTLPNSQQLELAWQQQSTQQEWQLALTQQDGWSSVTGWRIKHQYRFDSKIAASWQWLHQQTATESTGLLLAGMKNRWAAGLNWTPTGREYVNAELSLDDYLSQDGQNLGSGQIIQIDAGHRLFAAQSDHVLKITLGIGKFSPQANISPAFNMLLGQGQNLNSGFFIPQDYQQLGIAWAFGQVNDKQYQRGLRLMGELGVNSSNVGGTGVNARMGVQGSVFGNDRLSLQLIHSQSGQQNGETNQQLVFGYRLFY